MISVISLPVKSLCCLFRRLSLPLSLALKWSILTCLCCNLPLEEILKRLKTDFLLFVLFFILLEIDASIYGASKILFLKNGFARVLVIPSNIRPTTSKRIYPLEVPLCSACLKQGPLLTRFGLIFSPWVY